MNRQRRRDDFLTDNIQSEDTFRNALFSRINDPVASIVIQGDVYGNIGDGGAYNQHNTPTPHGGVARPAAAKPKPPPRPGSPFASRKKLLAWLSAFEGKRGFKIQLHVLSVGIFANNTPRFINWFRDEVHVIWLNYVQKRQDQKHQAQVERRKAQGYDPRPRYRRDKDGNIIPPEDDGSIKPPSLDDEAPALALKNNIYRQTRTAIRRRSYLGDNVQAVVFIDPDATKLVRRVLIDAPLDTDFQLVREVMIRQLVQICKFTDEALRRRGADHPNLARFQAAIALGEIASTDESLFRKICSDWTVLHTHYQTMLSFFFLGYAHNRECEARVFTQVEQWARGQVPSLQRADYSEAARVVLLLTYQVTAAYVCSTLGRVNPARAMEILNISLLSLPVFWVLIPFFSIMQLFQQATLAPTVLAKLAYWTRKPGDQHYKRLILQIFVKISLGEFSAEVAAPEPRPKRKREELAAQNGDPQHDTAAERERLMHEAEHGRRVTNLPTIWEVIHTIDQQPDGRRYVRQMKDDLTWLMKQCCRETGSIGEEAYKMLHSWMLDCDHNKHYRHHIQQVLLQLYEDPHGHYFLNSLMEAHDLRRSPTTRYIRHYGGH